MLTNLSKRVQKSKALKFNFIPGTTSPAYGTTSHDGENHYQVFISKTREVSQFGDKEISHDTITVKCIRCGGIIHNCPGNSRNTICYHGLGAIRHHLNTKKHTTISFCEDIFDAVKLRKPNQSLVKIVSDQGDGILWGVVERSFEGNVNLMRGSKEESEGID